MSKAYSNRALPAGTVLREWRLEEVLGVGGFGIVYKGRGIYFNELVAIKEYFPSSISERAEDDTVVPIDSNAEEVHALGLKKFVEEAKLLWNLSTPTRHPNIVSVRSLFEVHGTAYMVMDFEDGTSLSRLLKKGRRFNEASLRSMILPIAEGLERAHRVGVLHRDIKPPNIIINDDGRSVLIDFGSARFESGEATSTKVTFHTPPYAAIEQYVRTFPQGPWTDIYALGIVLYECITGEKPAEVLERMHGEAGTPLADGVWPGFSRSFLSAIDKAMAVRPADRPQSISEWIAMLDAETVDETDDENAATRIGTWDTTAPNIVPVAPTKEGFTAPDRKIETGVPDTPSKAEFNTRTDKPEQADALSAGDETSPKLSKEVKEQPLDKAPPQPGDAAPPVSGPEPAGTADDKAKGKPEPGLVGSERNKESQIAKPAAIKDEPSKGLPTKAIAGGVAAIALVAIAGWALSGSNEGKTEPAVETAALSGDLSNVTAAEIDPATSAKLVEEARAAGMTRDLVALLQPATAGSSGMAGGSAPTVTISTLAGFGLEAVTKAKSLVASVRQPGQREARRMRDGLAALEVSAAAIRTSEQPETAVASTRQVIEAFRQLNGTVTTARLASRTDEPMAASAKESTMATATPQPATVIPEPGVAATASAASGTPVSQRSRRQFESALSGARSVARQVIRLGDRDRPGANATEQERQDYRVRQGAASAARDYEKYLDGLEASMRGNITDADAVESIAKANQTRAYLSDLLKRSQLTLR